MNHYRKDHTAPRDSSFQKPMGWLGAGTATVLPVTGAGKFYPMMRIPLKASKTTAMLAESAGERPKHGGTLQHTELDAWAVVGPFYNSYGKRGRPSRGLAFISAAPRQIIIKISHYVPSAIIKIPASRRYLSEVMDVVVKIGGRVVEVEDTGSMVKHPEFWKEMQNRANRKIGCTCTAGSRPYCGIYHISGLPEWIGEVWGSSK